MLTVNFHHAVSINVMEDTNTQESPNLVDTKTRALVEQGPRALVEARPRELVEAEPRTLVEARPRELVEAKSRELAKTQPTALVERVWYECDSCGYRSGRGVHDQLCPRCGGDVTRIGDE